jgi:hypothetical protein
MNSRSKENIKTETAVSRCYFIKPFEVMPTMESFISTWKSVYKIYRDVSEVKEVNLIQNISGESKYGFISYSDWNSKKDFIKRISSNPVLKYHNSGLSHLYKPDKLFDCKTIKLNNFNTAIIFEASPEYDRNISEYFISLTEKYDGIIKSKLLFKAIYKNSKQRFIGLLNISRSNIHINGINNSGIKTHCFNFKKVK